MEDNSPRPDRETREKLEIKMILSFTEKFFRVSEGCQQNLPLLGNNVRPRGPVAAFGLFKQPLLQKIMKIRVKPHVIQV